MYLWILVFTEVINSAIAKVQIRIPEFGKEQAVFFLGLLFSLGLSSPVLAISCASGTAYCTYYDKSAGTWPDKSQKITVSCAGFPCSIYPNEQDYLDKCTKNINVNNQPKKANTLSGAGDNICPGWE
ncbi:hypothetical protein Bealeia1_00243 [Candidatus Bealeia paramacronuclearis]|uniref:Uncharacterized protein n=1 Tax=Candidatus Bealeia paramacronuclearis TaxID=1921001 RepID=A0ABZ2C0T6_9PROT|nr:hypothetical protein [Candidatus Bealeia paramacronuclearis]